VRVFEPRPYQERHLGLVRGALARGKRSILTVSPTGSGKTVVALRAAAHHLSRGGMRVLFTAPRRELVDQTIAMGEEMGLNVGDVASGARVQIETVQTLLARGPLPFASLRIHDEAHHLAASEWSQLAKAPPGVVTLGFSATPERGDGIGLRVAFDEIVVLATTQELIDQGYLVPCIVHAPSRVLKAGTVAQSPVDSYLAHAPGSRCIVFATHVKAALAHCLEFRAKGIKAGLVTGDMNPTVRMTLLDQFRTGEVHVLCNVFVLTEGFDVPAVDTVILARGCQSAGTLLQMIGRALRPSPGKTHATLLDLRGVTHVLGTAEEDRVYSLDGRGIRRKNEVTERYCQVCGVLLSPDDVVCPDCGREPDELTAPKVTGDKLTKFVYRPRATDDEKAAKLAALMALGRERGYSPKAAFVKYAVLFGTWPTPQILARLKAAS